MGVVGRWLEMTEKNDSRQHARKVARRPTSSRTESESSWENPTGIELSVANGTDRSCVLERDANLRRTLLFTRNQPNGANKTSNAMQTGEYASDNGYFMLRHTYTLVH